MVERVKMGSDESGGRIDKIESNLGHGTFNFPPSRDAYPQTNAHFTMEQLLFHCYRRKRTSDASKGWHEEQPLEL